MLKIVLKKEKSKVEERSPEEEIVERSAKGQKIMQEKM